MNRDSSSFASRREFLFSGGVFAAAAFMDSPAPGQQQEGKVPQPQQQQPATAPQDTAAGIAAQTFSEAQKLAGIEFTEAERQMMADSIAEQLGWFKARLQQPYPANSLAPAHVFDPRLPGRQIDQGVRRFTRSTGDVAAAPSNDEDIAFAPLASLSRWIERRELTSARLTDIYLERLKHVDPKLKCVITLTEDLARAQAERADQEIAAGRYRGALHGIPWGAKDLLDTAGIKTTWGAEPFADRVPQSDAAVVRKLNQAGAVLIAKLSLGALAYNDIWFGGRTNNPWNPEQGSSGSSAGSAAATAAGLVGFSIGTETYGSIVSPCMRCGTTGLRPTFGRVSRAGAMALCWSLDKLGPICRTVEDCAVVLSAINGPDENDPSSIDMGFSFDASGSTAGMRLGYSPKWFENDAAHGLDRQALEAAGKIGVELVQIDVPEWPYDLLLSILLCEAAAAFEELTRTNQDDLLKWQEAEAWPNTFRKTWFIPGIEVIQAERFRRRCMEMMAERFETVDAMIAPSFAASLCLITNNTGHPSLTLRSGFRNAKQDDPSSPSVPHGITLVGRLFEEGKLCRIGMALERELDVWHRRPSL